MGQPTKTSLPDLRRRSLCTLAVLSMVLTLALSGMAFVWSGSVSYRSGRPALDAHDIDAKALQPQQHLALRGVSRSIRVASTRDTGAALIAFQSPQQTAAYSAAAPSLHSGISAYLERRTNCPRGPPSAGA